VARNAFEEEIGVFEIGSSLTSWRPGSLRELVIE
jgi:hypothetical protein